VAHFFREPHRRFGGPVCRIHSRVLEPTDDSLGLIIPKNDAIERCDSRGTWQTVPTFLQHRRCVGSWSWFDFDGKESATVIDSRGGCRLPRNGLPDGHLVNFWTHAVPGLDIGVIAA
jgi:hypothetical protein